MKDRLLILIALAILIATAATFICREGTPSALVVQDYIVLKREASDNGFLFSFLLPRSKTSDFKIGEKVTIQDSREPKSRCEVNGQIFNIESDPVKGIDSVVVVVQGLGCGIAPDKKFNAIINIYALQ